MTRSRLAFVGMIAACILWGSSHAVAKSALERVQPLPLGAMRICIAAVVLRALQFTTRQPTITASDRIPMARLSMIGVVASMVVGLHGINLTTSSDVSLLIIGEVIFTALFAFLLSGEIVAKSRLFGIMIGTVGAAILIGGSVGSNTTRAPNRLLGDILFLASVACEAYYTVRGGSFVDRYGPVSMLAWVNGISMIVCFPVVVWFLIHDHYSTLSTSTILGIIYLAIVPTVFCYLLWFAAVRRIGASAGSVALLAQPVVGSLIGILVMGDPLTVPFGIGGVLILSALLLTSLSVKGPLS